MANKKRRNRREDYKEDIDEFDDIIEINDDGFDQSSDFDMESTKKELNDYMKKRIDNEVSKKLNSIKTNLNDIELSSVKDDLIVYMKGKIDSEVSNAVERANKKLIKYKNGIIIKRDIFIVILLAICFFLGYNLYNISSINIDIKREVKNTSTIKRENTEEEKKQTEEVSSDYDNLVKKYKYLVKRILVNEDSSYLKDFYEGNLTDEIRLYIAFDNLDSSLINSDDETIYVDENKLKEKYDELFCNEYEANSFKYNDINFKYLSSKEMFLGVGKLRKNGTAIEKEIIDIKEGDDLIITTVEGIVSKEKLYNILDGKEISDYKGDSLDSYEDSLIKLEYTFKNVDDTYKLTEIKIK